MLYRKLAEVFDSIESKSKRLEMTDELIRLFRSCSIQNMEFVIRLTQGEVRPGYEGVDIGVAEKMAVKALNLVTAIPEREINDLRKKTGDIGRTAEMIIGNKKQTSLFSTPLTVKRVFENLERIASREGKSSRDYKLKIIAEMLHDSGSLESRYVIRTLCSRMRLGIADMTIIDALTYSFTGGVDDLIREIEESKKDHSVEDIVKVLKNRTTGSLNIAEEYFSNSEALDPDYRKRLINIIEELKNELKTNRERIVRYFNIHPDLGHIGYLLVTGGMEKLQHINVEPGIPLRAMLGERLRSMGEILEKMGGRCYLEYKYDGLRIQCHIGKDGRITLFSRQLEKLTDQFPDVAESLSKGFLGDDCIVEGECVPINPQTGEMLPFQVISKRRGRKHDLKDKIEEIPVRFVIFDCLYFNGRDLTSDPYPKRRDMIREAFPDITSDTVGKSGISLSVSKLVDNPGEGEEFFLKAIDEGCEGVMAKSISKESIYRAGSRGWLWIKYKKDYRSELTDTLDLVVIGGFHGAGRRAGTIGALLMAAYDAEENRYKTVCKLGSGFTDQNLQEIKEILSPLIRENGEPNPQVDTNMKPDLHIDPEVVLEVLGAEISFSPVHTCGRGRLKKDFGLALRFPRFTGRFRDDKSPMDATSVSEIESFYLEQRKAAN